MCAHGGNSGARGNKSELPLLLHGSIPSILVGILGIEMTNTDTPLPPLEYEPIVSTDWDTEHREDWEMNNPEKLRKMSSYKTRGTYADYSEHPEKYK